MPSGLTTRSEIEYFGKQFSRAAYDNFFVKRGKLQIPGLGGHFLLKSLYTDFPLWQEVFQTSPQTASMPCVQRGSANKKPETSTSGLLGKFKIILRHASFFVWR